MRGAARPVRSWTSRRGAKREDALDHDQPCRRSLATRAAGAIRLERHRLGNPDGVRDSYDTFAGILAAVV